MFLSVYYVELENVVCRQICVSHLGFRSRDVVGSLPGYHRWTQWPRKHQKRHQHRVSTPFLLKATRWKLFHALGHLRYRFSTNMRGLSRSVLNCFAIFVVACNASEWSRGFHNICNEECLMCIPLCFFSLVIGVCDRKRLCEVPVSETKYNRHCCRIRRYSWVLIIVPQKGQFHGHGNKQHSRLGCI